MKKKISLIKNDNCLTLELDGSPTYLKIYDENENLKRVCNKVSKTYTYFTKPGKYIVTSDASDIRVKTNKVDLPRLNIDKVRIAKEFGKTQVYINDNLIQKEKTAELIKKGNLNLDNLKRSVVNNFNRVILNYIGKTNLSAAMKSLIITEVENQTGIKVKKSLDEFVDEWLKVEKSILSATSVDKLFEILERFAG